MSLLSMSCSLALQLASPFDLVNLADAAPPAQSPFAAQTVSDRGLAAVHGMALPIVGTDQIGPASRSRVVSLGLDTQRVALEIREVTDNWNVAVATPLIAEAFTSSRG